MKKQIYPIISIVTICRNAEKVIGKTIHSVLSQLYQEFEYIIIDGNSTDRTLEIINGIIREYDYSCNIKLISEEDLGISDAFNKGVRNANGKYLLFLNAGDCFSNNYVINNSINYLEKQNNDVITFSIHSELIDKNPNTEEEGLLKWNESIIPHQSTFIKRTVFDQDRVGLFNQDYKVRMDYEFFSRCKKANCSFTCVPDVIVDYDVNGISATDRYNYFREGLAVKLLYNKTINLPDFNFFVQENNKSNGFLREILLSETDLEHPIIVYGCGVYGYKLYHLIIENSKNKNEVYITDTYEGDKYHYEYNGLIANRDNLLSIYGAIWIISIQNRDIIDSVIEWLDNNGISKSNQRIYDAISNMVCEIN